MIVRVLVAALLFAQSAASHEMTPTYFDFKPSYVDGVYVTTMSMWNRRNDVEYYEISVFDGEWNNLPFASRNRVFRLLYLDRQKIDIYIKREDLKDVKYICTSSKQLKSDVKSTGVKSTICSRIER